MLRECCKDEGVAKAVLDHKEWVRAILDAAQARHSAAGAAEPRVHDLPLSRDLPLSPMASIFVRAESFRLLAATILAVPPLAPLHPSPPFLLGV